MTLIRKMAAPAAAFAVAALLFGALATSAQAQTPPFSAYGIGQTPGAVVVELEADGAASRAGLRKADVVLQVAGKTAQGLEDIRRLLLLPGEHLLQVRRQGKVITLRVRRPR